MNIHEYQAKLLLRESGITVPTGMLVTSVGEVRGAFNSLDAAKVVVKAQIHSGGRGLAGGVKLASSIEECEGLVKNMLGSRLITRQTGPQGKVVNKVYIETASNIAKEYYLALTINRDNTTIDVMFTTEGGMDIEEVAGSHPEKLPVVQIDVDMGVRDFHLFNLLHRFALDPQEKKQICDIVKKIYRLFLDKDCSMIEINPLAVNDQGQLFALDAKVAFDDNALFRHKDIWQLRDIAEEDPREARAVQFGLNYVSLEGDIACMVNGAGLAMATMDTIKLFGGEPANFLDVGGSATEEAITEAFRILVGDPSIKGIFVNIFGGIMKCDLIAKGILAATGKIDLKIPLVVRLSGTNAEQGKELLRASPLTIIAVDDMAAGAKRIVQLVHARS